MCFVQVLFLDRLTTLPTLHACKFLLIRVVRKTTLTKNTDAEHKRGSITVPGKRNRDIKRH